MLIYVRANIEWFYYQECEGKKLSFREFGDTWKYLLWVISQEFSKDSKMMVKQKGRPPCFIGLSEFKKHSQIILCLLSVAVMFLDRCGESLHRWEPCCWGKSRGLCSTLHKHDCSAPASREVKCNWQAVNLALNIDFFSMCLDMFFSY